MYKLYKSKKKQQKFQVTKKVGFLARKLPQYFEPKNQPIEKENHLNQPTLHFGVPW